MENLEAISGLLILGGAIVLFFVVVGCINRLVGKQRGLPTDRGPVGFRINGDALDLWNVSSVRWRTDRH